MSMDERHECEKIYECDDIYIEWKKKTMSEEICCL